MGWSSYYENIHERLLEDLSQLRKAVEVGRELSAHASNEEYKDRLLNVIDELAGRLNRLLEVATHPDLNMAEDYLRLCDENDRLRSGIVSALTEDVNDLAQCRLVLAAERQRSDALTKEVEVLRDALAHVRDAQKRNERKSS